MDAQLKAKWVEALRSGDYTQARGGVGDKDTKHLCCLGVGAVVANPDINLYDTEIAVKELEKHGLINQFDKNQLFTGEVSRLIEMNDTLAKPFAEIADYIEANL